MAEEALLAVQAEMVGKLGVESEEQEVAEEREEPSGGRSVEEVKEVVAMAEACTLLSEQGVMAVVELLGVLQVV